MSVYAKIDNNIVVNIIEADRTFIISQPDADSYKLLSRGGIGWTYNPEVNVFIEPQPYGSWTLDENFDWQPPTPMPSDASFDKQYLWNEAELMWVAI